MSRSKELTWFRGLAILLIACVVGWLGWVIAESGPVGGPAFIGLPEAIDFGTNLVVAAISENPPVQISVTVNGVDVPGSPDTGADTPGSINTGTFLTGGFTPGTQLVVKATDAANQSVTRIVRIR